LLLSFAKLSSEENLKLRIDLEDLVATVLDIDRSSLNDTSSPASLDSWDSLAHVELITTVEETYDVILTTAEMRRADSIGELRRILQSKGIAA
jgi:acyl carrier protein